MKLTLAQINATVGDLEGNVSSSVSAVQTAQRQGADLVILPEMTIPGYPPRDILFDPSFTEAVQAATQDLAHQTRSGPPVLVGSLWQSDFKQPQHPGLWNAAVLLHKGTVTLAAAKQLLPIYDVFHEPRWFAPGPALPPISIEGEKIGVIICEDMWDEGYQTHPGQYLLNAGATRLICLSASPFRQNKLENRLHHARRQNAPIVYLNLVGATDELIFDGHSFALDQTGQMVASHPGVQEADQTIDLASAVPIPHPSPAPEPELYAALTLGIRDFAAKNGLKHAFLGLSGGIDSALTAVLAAEALGPKNVTAVAIPSRYSDPRSTDCARELADNLGIGFEVVELDPLHKTAETSLAPWLESGTTAENIQARLRAMILMALVNARRGFLLNTSNKTELALGYATLYGDMAGSLCPIADLTKPDVYKLSRWIQTERGIIPDFIIERPPSAELRPDQVDPFDYDIVAPALEELILQHQSNSPIRRSEHKRWHMGVILKVSDKAFGSGRLIPITRR
jgi:NAD+ synthase (glutamine-hydrolysing)